MTFLQEVWKFFQSYILPVLPFVAIVLTLTVLPAVLVALDKWVVYGKKNRFNGPNTKE